MASYPLSPGGRNVPFILEDRRSKSVASFFPRRMNILRSVVLSTRSLTSSSVEYMELFDLTLASLQPAHYGEYLDCLARFNLLVLWINFSQNLHTFHLVWRENCFQRFFYIVLSEEHERNRKIWVPIFKAGQTFTHCVYGYFLLLAYFSRHQQIMFEARFKFHDTLSVLLLTTVMGLFSTSISFFCYGSFLPHSDSLLLLAESVSKTNRNGAFEKRSVNIP